MFAFNGTAFIFLVLLRTTYTNARLLQNNQSSDVLHYYSLLERAGADPPWIVCAKKGRRLYQEIESKQGPDDQSPSAAVLNEKIHLNLRSLSEPWDGIITEYELLRELNYKTSGFTRFSANWPLPVETSGDDAFFDGVISVEQGIFMMIRSKRGKLPWYLSQVSWWIWQRAVQREHPEHKDDPLKHDYSGLTSFWRSSITNEPTAGLIFGIFSDNDPDATLIELFTPEGKDNSNPFWVLLGTPNGAGIAHLVRENKEALRGKTVTNIWARKTEFEDYTIWADIASPKSQKRQEGGGRTVPSRSGHNRSENLEASVDILPSVEVH